MRFTDRTTLPESDLLRIVVG
jgi:hypothetical protein